MADGIEVRGLTKAYSGQLAMDEADLSIRPGEVHGLVGENGAGKSTLIKALAGIVQPDGGEIRVDGEVQTFRSSRDARAKGLHFVHQDLGLVDRLDVGQNVFLGRQLFGRGPSYSRKATAREALQVLEGFVDVDPRTPVGKLTLAERWMIAIARVCYGPSRLVVMDEPTVALSDTETKLVFDAIDRLRARGTSVLLVTHRLPEVMRACDRVTVMKDGRTIGTHGIGELDEERLVTLITGEMGASERGAEAADVRASAGPVILEARNLSGGAVRDVSLQLRAGEILGIGGLVGSGRSSLLQMLFGSKRPKAGELSVEGNQVQWGSPAAAVKAGIAMIPEDRRADGLLLHRSIRENTVLAHLDRCRGGSGLPVPSRGRELDFTREQIESLRIACSGPGQLVSALSGGNQQKVLLSRWLISPDLRILLLDEPTKGIDVGAKAELFAVIRELAAEGVGVIFVSSDIEEVAEFAHRILVLVEGRVVGELSGPTDETEILRHCYGNTQAVAS